MKTESHRRRKPDTIRKIVAALVLLQCGVAAALAGQPSKRAAEAADLPFQIKHALLANLGGEHVANAVHRRTARGLAVVAWGDRIVEWPLDGMKLREVVAPVEGQGYTNGGCALDITGDGIDEIVVARGRGRWANDPELCWFQENPAGQWTAHVIGPVGVGGATPHDLVPISFQIAGTGRIRGVVVVIGRRQVVWFQIPDDPVQPWTKHAIAQLPENNQSGLVTGDVAGHGRPDLVCGMYWVECPADPLREKWKVRRFGDWAAPTKNSMAKLQLGDMNGDGHLDIVASQAEIPDSKLGIFSRDPKNPDAMWAHREIDAGLYCPHSLILTDLDGDGRTDIIVGEMTAGGWRFPLNPNPRIMAYLNRGKEPYERRLLVQGSGVHEMGILPRERGGPVVLYAADETQTHKFPDMKTHVNMWTIRWER